MNYWHSLLLLCLWMAILTVSGRPLARLLSPHLRAIALLHLSPALGLSIHLLVATGAGWLFGTRPAIVLPCTALLVATALWLERDWAQLARHVTWSIFAGAVVSIGTFVTLHLYGGYNAYNDTFTYLVHAQWLQDHAFREPVALDILSPVYTQVSLYQVAGLRMGASFFLGWLQAASPFAWSIYVYPTAIAVALTAGAHAIGGLAAALRPSRRKGLPLVWSLVAGTSVSGLTYGCFMGFLPQIFGLALCTCLVALLVCFRPSSPTSSWREVLPLATTFCALGFSYSELLPFASLTLIGWLGVRLFLVANRAAWLAAALRFAGWALLLLNFECIRIVRALALQSKAVVGWAVPWSEGEFASHALGLHSGLGDGDWWLLPPKFAVLLAQTMLLALAIFAVRLQPRRLARWSAPLVFLVVCGAAFAIFRHQVASPWPTGTGQTWNQFKLSNWGSPVLLALVGTGFLWLGRHRITALLVGVVMALWLGMNVQAHFQLATERIGETLRLTGKTQNPFSVYEAIRADALAAQPPGQIFLDLGGSDHKSRQIAAYFLHDFQVAADWTGDGYITSRMPPGWEAFSPATSRWWVHRRNIASTEAATGDHGVLVFSQAPKFLVTQQQITGGHGVESDASGWWSWSPDRLKVQLKIYGKLPAQVSLKLTCIAAAEPRRLTFVCRSAAGELFSETATIGEGWQSYVSVPFRVTTSEIEVEISSQSVPVPLGGSDPRVASFLAKNVRLEFVRADP